MVLSSDVLPVQWVESQASVLLLTLLKQSRTQYELRRLLQLLVDMERLLKSNGQRAFLTLHRSYRGSCDPVWGCLHDTAFN